MLKPANRVEQIGEVLAFLSTAYQQFDKTSCDKAGIKYNIMVSMT